MSSPEAEHCRPEAEHYEKEKKIYSLSTIKKKNIYGGKKYVTCALTPMSAVGLRQRTILARPACPGMAGCSCA